MAGGGGLLGQPAGKAHPIEGSSATEDGFGTGIMAARIKFQPRFGGEAVAGEGAGRFSHIALAVVALTKGKELKQLAGEVFVGVAAVIGGAVER